MTTSSNAKTRTPDKSKKDHAATLKNLKAQAEVNFPVIVWKVEQVFTNPTEEFVELIYTFPTAHGSILQNITVQLGERRLTGQVISATQAEDSYSDSIADGNSAILIEKNDFGLFTMNIGNLGPGETCQIHFESAALLDVVEGEAKIIFPTVIDTRYGDPAKQGGLGIHARPKNSWLVEYPLDLSVTVNRSPQQLDISSATHKIKVSHGAGLVIELGEISYLDRDFELTLGNIANKQPGFVFRDPFSETEQFMSLSTFAWEEEISTANHSNPSPLKILVDCSGSMEGARIEQAKKALHGILSSLNPDHKFTLSKFGNETYHFYNKPMRAGSASLKSAFDWIESLTADLGGTELIHAVEEVSKLGNPGPSDVFLITDGEIWDGKGFLKQLKHHQIRLFVVAIGASSNSNMLISAAKSTCGHVEIPHSDLHVEESALRLSKRIYSPHAKLISCTLDGSLSVWHETNLPIFKYQSIPVFSIQSSLATESILTINIGDNQSAKELELRSTLNEVQDLSLCETLARLCVSKALEELEMEYESTDSFPVSSIDSPTPWVGEEELEDLALIYQLLSSRTKYLVMEERDVKADGLPKVVGVDHMPVTSLGESLACMNQMRISLLDSISPPPQSSGPSIPAVFRSERSNLSDLFEEPRHEVGRYPASQIELLKAKFKFDSFLRKVFDDFSVTYSPPRFNVPAFLGGFSEQYAIDEGVPPSLIAWAKSQANNEDKLRSAIRAIFNLIRIKREEAVLTHTQFPRGSWERNLAQVLGYIA